MLGRLSAQKYQAELVKFSSIKATASQQATCSYNLMTKSSGNKLPLLRRTSKLRPQQWIGSRQTKTGPSLSFEQAQRSHDRTQKLSKQNAISQEDVDKAIEALAVAVAGASRAEAAITEGQKELIAAEKTLEYHRTRLKDSAIVAPFDGLIVKRVREPGDVVVPGSAVLTLISTDELWISAWVDETEMERLKQDQKARVVFRSESDKSFPATVVRLGKEADRETREFIVDVRVLELPKNWAVGTTSGSIHRGGAEGWRVCVAFHIFGKSKRPSGRFSKRQWSCDVATGNARAA